MPGMHPLVFNHRSSPRVNARRTLPRLTSEYFAQVRHFLNDSSAPKDLHRIRLATKRFRYTLELFRPCYGTGLETRIATLRKVQKHLGDVNDSVASWSLLSNLLPKSPQRKKVHEYLKTQADKDAADFLKLWKEEFDAPGKERWWKTYLKKPGTSS